MDAPQEQNPYLGLDQNELNQRLWEAASYNDLTNVSLLIAAKANVNAQDEESRTPLMYAVDNGCYEVAELLTNNKDVALNISSLPNGFTALEYAADNGNPMILDLLIMKNVERIQKLPEGQQKQEEQKQIQQRIEKILDKKIKRDSRRVITLYPNLSFEENAKLAESKKDYSVIFRLLSAIPSTEDKRVNKADIVKKFDAALQQAKTKLYKVMMPSFLKKHSQSIFCTLPLDLINYIRDLQLQLEFSSSHSWYQHRIKNDLDNSGKEIVDYMNINKYFLPGQKRKAADSAKTLTHAPAPVITPLQDSKKRKAEDELDENGRNKRMRVESQDEQESTYSLFGGYCSLQ